MHHKCYPNLSQNLGREIVVKKKKRSGLYIEDLHRYLLCSQPERVARWLLVRTGVDQAECSKGLPGLGMTEAEVEVLFADDTPEEIEKLVVALDPFLEAFDLSCALHGVATAGNLEHRCPEDHDDIGCPCPHPRRCMNGEPAAPVTNKARRVDFRSPRFEADTRKMQKMRKVPLTLEKQGLEEIPQRKNGENA